MRVSQLRMRVIEAVNEDRRSVEGRSRGLADCFSARASDCFVWFVFPLFLFAPLSRFVARAGE